MFYSTEISTYFLIVTIGWLAIPNQAQETTVINSIGTEAGTTSDEIILATDEVSRDETTTTDNELLVTRPDDPMINDEDDTSADRSTSTTDATAASTTISEVQSTTTETVNIVDYTSDIFNADCIRAHNHFRSLHGATPLKMDKEITEFARLRAAKLARINDISYLRHEDSSYGENLAAWPLIANKPIVNCSEVTKIWFDEYKYVTNWTNPESFSPYTYHFTQVVWSTTLSMGCGIASPEGSNWLFICCNYSPPGNYLDQFIENVKYPLNYNEIPATATLNETLNEVPHPPQIGKNCKCTCEVEL